MITELQIIVKMMSEAKLMSPPFLRSSSVCMSRQLVETSLYSCGIRAISRGSVEDQSRVGEKQRWLCMMPKTLHQCWLIGVSVAQARIPHRSLMIRAQASLIEYRECLRHRLTRVSGDRQTFALLCRGVKLGYRTSRLLRCTVDCPRPLLV